MKRPEIRTVKIKDELYISVSDLLSIMERERERVVSVFVKKLKRSLEHYDRSFKK